MNIEIEERWTHSPRTATLRRDGDFIAILSKDGSNKIDLDLAHELCTLLNIGQQFMQKEPVELDAKMTLSQLFQQLGPAEALNVAGHDEQPEWEPQHLVEEEPLEMSEAEWDLYVGTIAQQLDATVSDLEGASRHIVVTGNDMGGWQCAWDDECAEDIDWEEYWRNYNARFGTSVTWDSDPFCC